MMKPCEDGKYRWAYEFDMLRNPIIILTIWKIFILVLLGIWLVFGAFHIKDMGLIEAYAAQTKELLIPLVILFVLSIAGYLILAGVYGWKYCVLFEMDDEGIHHIQMEKQFKKAEALGWLTAAAGMASGKPGAAGSGLLAATRNELYSSFSNVRRISVRRTYHAIKLNAPLNHNQVYVSPEDFDFVLSFITERAVNARIR